jgi:hypothetical protein
MMGGSGGSGLSSESDDLDSIVQLYTDDNFRQLCPGRARIRQAIRGTARKCISLIFNNYDLSHSEQFDTDLFSVLVATSGPATVEGKNGKESSKAKEPKDQRSNIFSKFPIFFVESRSLKKRSRLL